MKKFGLKLLFVLTMLQFVSCATTKTYLGNWNYTLSTPQGDGTGLLIISEDGDATKCHVSDDGGAEFDFEECSVEDNIFKGHYFQDGYRADVSGTIDGNTMSGMVSVEGNEIPVTLIKQEE